LNKNCYRIDWNCRLIDEGGFPSQIFADTFFDIFVFSHFIGWVGFALIMRDVKVNKALCLPRGFFQFPFVCPEPVLATHRF
jgi:hypothetical protein